MLESFDQLGQSAYDLASISDNTLQLQHERWKENIKEARDSLTGETTLLFIGGFSSGKSTFINALLGESVLPTASRPCTSVITEIEFTDDGNGSRGIIYFIDGSEREGSFEYIQKVVDGSTGEFARLASIHHVTLIYDLNSINDDTNSINDELNSINDEIDNFSPLRILLRGKIRLIDSPGFGSPYGINKLVLKEYAARASYTFWFSSANNIGGIMAREELKRIKRKTSVIIPVITKADLIGDDIVKGQIIEQFINHMGDLFTVKTPRFVSAIKLFEAKNKKSFISKLGLSLEDLEEANKEILELEQSSGMEQIAYDVLNIAVTDSDKNINDRLNASAKDLLRIGNEIRSVSVSIKERWTKVLQNNGWTEDQSFKYLVEQRKSLYMWANSKSEEISIEFGDRLSEKMTDLFIKSKGKISDHQLDQLLKSISDDVLEPKLYDCAEYIQDKFATDYQAIIKAPTTPTPPNIQTVKDLVTNTVLSAFDAAGSVGPRTMLTGASGAIFMSISSSIASISVYGVNVGAKAVPVFQVAGIGLLVLAMVPMIPALIDAYKARDNQRMQTIRNNIKKWLKTLEIKPRINGALQTAIDELYSNLTEDKNKELRPIINKREKARVIMENVGNILGHTKLTFNVNG